MRDLYFEDFTPGRSFASGGVTITESQILDFALVYDPQPFHIDLEASEKGPYGGLIASGFQTLALAFRVFYQAGIVNACSMGSPGMDELRWTRPVRPGDTISVDANVIEARGSASKPDRGIVRMAYEVKNQERETVMTFSAIHIMRRRPAEGRGH